MKISYRRTGGFAGMVMSFDIDTDALPFDDAKEIQELVSSVNFFTLPTQITSETSGVDQFQYKLTVTTKEQQHTIEVGDSAVPENLWPLLNKIRVLSRTTRNS